MEWMYNRQNEIDRDAYLLGRSIDATFVEVAEEAKKRRRGEIKPLNNFKFQEDPLNMIEAKKSEFKLELMKNPLKMRKLKAKFKYASGIGAKDQEEQLNTLDIKILKKWKKLRKLCFYFQNIPLEEFAMTLFKNQKHNIDKTLLKHDIKSEENKKHQEFIKINEVNTHKSTQSTDDYIIEMKRNAEWNHNQRKKVLQENPRDDDHNVIVKPEKFIQPMLSDITKSNTLGSRITKNMNYIQRNTSDFKSDFVGN